MLGAPRAPGGAAAPAPPGDQRLDGDGRLDGAAQGEIENPNDGEQSTRTFSCRFCDKTFKKWQALGGHMNKHRLDREKEKYENALEFKEKYESNALALLSIPQQPPGSHSSNPIDEGGLAAQIAQNPSAPSGMTDPVLALGAGPLDIPPAHFNMQVPPLPTTSNLLQQIPSTLGLNEDNNDMDLNVPLAAASALENEPEPNSFQNHDLEDEVVTQNNQPPQNDMIVRNYAYYGSYQ